MISPGARRGTGNARADIPDAPKECNNRGASRFTRILLKCIPGKQSVIRMASSDRLETNECTHFRTSILYIHYKLISDYRQKRRLRVQNRSAGCIFSCTHPSRQQEVPTLCIQEQSLSVLSTSFGLNTAP